MTEAVLALDIGGTKLAAGLIGRDGAVLRWRTAPTPYGSGSAQLLDAVLAVLRDARGDAEPAVIGVGSAGPLDPFAGTVSPLNIPAWREFPLVAELESAFGRPVALAGDGHCFALAEHWLGAGQGSTALLGMVVSTGVGAGLVLDGAVRLGPSGNAGHLGHAIVDFEGPDCPCGSRGCVEAYAAGPHLVRWARSQGWTGETGVDLAASARAADPVGLAAFDRCGRALAAGILSAAAVVDLDTVVIGGGLSQAGPVLFDPVHRWLTRLAGLDFLKKLVVRPARLGTTAGVIGAAALGWIHTA